MSKLADELQELRFDLGVIQRAKCSEEETQHFKKLKKEGTPLPQDVFYNSGGDGALDPEYYYREVSSNLSEKEISELFLYRQTSYLKSIKNSAIFFVVLTTISMILTLIILFSGR
ncbi:MAG: hypothetical protein ACYC5K_07400 [Saccharofermentanales bacterium]